MSPVVDARAADRRTWAASNDGALTAFDADDRRTCAGPGRATGRATPRRVVATCAGVRQVVTQTQNALVGVAADTGALLWKVPLHDALRAELGHADRARRPRHLLGPRRPADARVRAVKKGAAFAPQTRLENADVAQLHVDAGARRRSALRPVAQEEGPVFAVDAATGKTLWLSEGRQAENAAMLAGGGRALPARHRRRADGRRGRATAFARSGSGRSPVGDLGAPRGHGRGVLVKDVETLALLRIAEADATRPLESRYR